MNPLSLPDSKAKLLDAAMGVIRRKGYHATRVEDICQEAGVSKGSFFHHFRSKEEAALAAAQRFAERAEELFGHAAHRAAADPLDRLIGYVDFRRSLMQGDLAAFTCLLGTMAQETYSAQPHIAEACGRHIDEHAATLMPDIAAAKAAHAPDAPWKSRSLALFIQAVIQGAFVLAKAKQDPAVAADCLDHLRRYLTMSFNEPAEKENAR